MQFSILIGKYLTPKAGYAAGRVLASLVASLKNLEINRSIRANQSIANPEVNSPASFKQIAKQVLTHAGECFYDFYHSYNKPAVIESLVPLTRPMKEIIRLSQENKGYVIVAPHLSNFDLVVCALVHYGFQGKVLSYPNPGSGYRLQNQIRESFGLDIVPLGDSSQEREILEYIKGGGIIATGADRPVLSRKKRHYVNFFGKPSPLPVGYVTTALAANVPVIVVTAIMELDGTYGFRHSGPITLKQHKNKLDEIILNTEMVLKQVEEYIKLAPEQWLMFYPVWPDLITEG